MTYKEAKDILRVAAAEVEWNCPLDYTEAFKKAEEALDKQIPKSRPAALTGHGERLRKKQFVPHVITPLGIGNLSAAVRRSHTASIADRLSLGRAGNGQIETLPVLRETRVDCLQLT